MRAPERPSAFRRRVERRRPSPYRASGAPLPRGSPAMSSRTRFRCARGEASEAAAALEAVVLLGLAPQQQVQPVLDLLGRLYAMLTRLAKAGR